MAIIRSNFAQRLRVDYAFLARYEMKHGQSNPELVAVVHRLAGSAAMVGYSEISAVANDLDDALAEWSPNSSALLGKLLRVLENTFADEKPATG